MGGSGATSYGGYGMPDLAGLSALAYGGYANPDPYGAGAYGAAVAGGAYPAAQDYSGYQAAVAAAAAGAAPQSTDQIDPTSYYPDFWNYASYYGEAAARAYYTVWSPPEGTPPPQGMTIPVPVAADQNTNPTEATQAQVSQSVSPWAPHSLMNLL
jgi:hypothetical protein